MASNFPLLCPRVSPVPLHCYERVVWARHKYIFTYPPDNKAKSDHIEFYFQPRFSGAKKSKLLESVDLLKLEELALLRSAISLARLATLGAKWSLRSPMLSQLHPILGPEIILVRGCENNVGKLRQKW